MNRAQRRGNLVRVRGTAPNQLGIQRRDQVRSGVEFDAGLRADRSEKQERDAAGRFAKATALVLVASVVVETRQQRRNAARQAAKRGGA